MPAPQYVLHLRAKYLLFFQYDSQTAISGLSGCPGTNFWFRKSTLKSINKSGTCPSNAGTFGGLSTTQDIADRPMTLMSTEPYTFRRIPRLSFTCEVPSSMTLNPNRSIASLEIAKSFSPVPTEAGIVNRRISSDSKSPRRCSASSPALINSTSTTTFPIFALVICIICIS